MSRYRFNFSTAALLLALFVLLVALPFFLSGGTVSTSTASVSAASASVAPATIASASVAQHTSTNADYPTHHKTVEVDGLDIFYREAGPEDAPVILLLHGFPTSSHMFRNLIPELAGPFRVIAPDYVGYGNSAMPTVDEFEYTYDNLATVVDKFIQQIGVEKYSLYIMDIGAPIGMRLAAAHPERVEALVVQNGNIYEEGIAGATWDGIRAYWADPENEEIIAGVSTFFELETTIWQYNAGVRNPQKIEPESWIVPQFSLDRPGNKEIQLTLLYDYRNNITLYPEWQEYLIENQPPTLVVWGKNDPFFPAEGALPFLQDVETIEFHLLNTGHFALEEDGGIIAELMRVFLTEHVTNAAVD